MNRSTTGDPNGSGAGIHLKDHGPLTLAFALATILILVRALGSGVLDAGDGTQHYLIARHAWKHAVTGLDQWGKPLFSLLASPFAQWSPVGVTLFDAICIALAAVMIASRLPQGARGWAWAAPIMLFGCPQVASTVLAGLTEPLFGTLAVALCVLLERKRFPAGMALLSVLPFARPEYVVLAPFAVAFTLMHRAWRALPWMLLGPVLYCTATAILLGQPWLFFTEHSYSGRETYGTGDLWHFWERREEVLGTPLAWAAVLSLCVFVLLLWKDKVNRNKLFALAWLSLLPALGMLILHSYAFWKGGFGSAGFLRVLACGVPLLVYFILHVLASGQVFVRAPRTMAWVLPTLVTGYSCWAYADLRARLPLPIEADAVQRTQQQAAAFIRTMRHRGEKLVYHDPFLGALCNVDPWDPKRMDRTLWGPHDLADDAGITTGDLVAWDSHFAPHTGNTPLDSLMLSPRFKLLGSFAPGGRVIMEGRPYAIHVFHREDVRLVEHVDTLLSLSPVPQTNKLRSATASVSSQGIVFEPIEFPLEVKDIAPEAGLHRSVEFIAVVDVVEPAISEPPLMVVFEDGNDPDNYTALRLRAGRNEVRWHPRSAGEDLPWKVYLWNRARAPITLRRCDLLRYCVD